MSHPFAKSVGRAVVHRPVLTVFAVALGVRLLAAGAISLLFGGTLFFDDETYVRVATEIAGGELADVWRSYRVASLLGPLALLFRIFGPYSFVGQVLLAFAGAATAALAALLVSRATGNHRATLVAGLAVALLPSQVLWSSLVLKDGLVWALLAGLALITASAGRHTGGGRLAALGFAAGGVLIVLGFARPHMLLVAGIALVGAILVTPASGRLLRMGGALAMALLIPWVLGYGAAGFGLIQAIGSFEELRCSFAAGGATSFVEGCVRADGRPPAREAVLPQDSPTGIISHLPRGLSVMLLEPYPGQRVASPGLRVAAAEVVLWYPLLVLGMIGLGQVWRLRAVLTFPVLVGGGSLVGYALAQGNLGTAFRHRGALVWVVAVLAGVGVDWLLRQQAARHAGGDWSADAAELPRERDQQLPE